MEREEEKRRAKTVLISYMLRWSYSAAYGLVLRLIFRKEKGPGL